MMVLVIGNVLIVTKGLIDGKGSTTNLYSGVLS